MVQSKTFSSNLWPGVEVVVRWVGGFKTIQKNSDEPRTSYHCINIYLLSSDPMTGYPIHCTHTHTSFLTCLLPWLHYLLSKETFFFKWYVFCKIQLWGGFDCQVIMYLSQSPHYSLGKHKHVIVWKLQSGFPLMSTRNSCTVLSWLVKCLVRTTSPTSAKLANLPTQVEEFLQRYPSDKTVQFRIPHVRMSLEDPQQWC